MTQEEIKTFKKVIKKKNNYGNINNSIHYRFYFIFR